MWEPGPSGKDCPKQVKYGQIMEAFALNAISTLSIAPLMKEKGKGITTQGMLSIYGVSLHGLFDV